MPADPVIIDLPDEAATAAFAEDVATCLAIGDVVALHGSLGVGKTTFARALIRALADDPNLEVPSPTFTLVQTYAAGRLTVAHFDLYRLSDPVELTEIGFADAAGDAVVLVEWPERAGDRLPEERLDIVLEIIGSGRRATVSGGEDLAARFARSQAARTLLDDSGWRGANRRHLQGDASRRTYERIRAGTRRAVLMDWPPHGQLLSGDSRAAFRARDVRSFVAVDRALRAAGFSAPEIYAADMERGLLLLEDLGGEGIVTDGKPIEARYRRVIEMLAEIHADERPSALPLPDGSMHQLPPLGADALGGEIGVFIEWYVPHATGEALSDAAKSELASIWSSLIDRVDHGEKSWVLFDVQSPNLFWLEGRNGIAAVGLIDFQDMFYGPSAYDVASLCQDARVTIPVLLETSLRADYVALRRAAHRDFDVDSFNAAYAILAVSRTMKNLGAFARLHAAGKTNYISHFPRLREYLARALADPVLSRLALWYERHRIS